jgi:aminoglycoside phosphotransferase (APT) family kinase protein
MTDMLDLRGGLRCALEANGEAGSTTLCDFLTELLRGRGGADRLVSLSRLKAHVYRLHIASGIPWSSVVLKRLEPAIAQRNRLIAESWLPALGLGDRCARLLGEAADRSGDCVWHVYEDLGPETLAMRLDPERVHATVDLIAELHTRAARHVVLPEVRRYAGSLGVQYFIANVRDAIAVLEALAKSGIETPREHVGVADRLLARLVDLLADAPRRAHVFDKAAGPDTLLHGDMWTINVFVVATAQGPRARLVDWDRTGVGPFSYDLSTFLFRFRRSERPEILERYRRAVARAGWRVGSPSELDVLFDTAERARYANGVIWPVHALLQEGAAWGFPQLAEVERWFQGLDSSPPPHIPN